MDWPVEDSACWCVAFNCSHWLEALEPKPVCWYQSKCLFNGIFPDYLCCLGSAILPASGCSDCGNCFVNHFFLPGLANRIESGAGGIMFLGSGGADPFD